MKAFWPASFLTALVGVYLSARIKSSGQLLRLGLAFLLFLLLLWGLYLLFSRRLCPKKKDALALGRLYLKIITFLVCLCLFFTCYGARSMEKKQALSKSLIQAEDLQVYVYDISGYDPALQRTRAVLRGKCYGQSFSLLASLPGRCEIGQVFSLSGKRLELARPKGGRGQFDEAAYFLAKDYRAQVYLRDRPQTLGQVRMTLPLILKDRRQSFFKSLDGALGEKASFVKAMVFGQSRDLDPAYMQAFEKLGIRHLLAVSGMHVGVVLSLFILVCALFSFSGWGRAVFLMSGLFSFYLAGGQSSSTLRAVLMISLYLLFECLQLEKKALAAWSLAGLIMLIFHPFYYYDLGFRLSFAATGGIIFLYPALVKIFSFKPFCLGLSAWLFSLPFQAPFFKSTLLGVFLTPFFALFLIALLPVGLLAFIFHPTFFSSLLLAGLSWLLSFFKGLIDLCLRFPAYQTISQFFTFSLPQLEGWRIFVYYAILLSLSFFCRSDQGQGQAEKAFKGGSTGKIRKGDKDAVRGINKGADKYKDKDRGNGSWWVQAWGQGEGRRAGLFRALLCGLILFLNVGFLRQTTYPRGLEISFINVGQGDAVMVAYEDFRLLVDTGIPKMGERAVVPFLAATGTERIDLLVLTHPDRDHMGGLGAVLDVLVVDQVCFSRASQIHLEEDQEDLLFDLKKRGVPYSYHQRGQAWQLGELSVEVISPDAGFSSTDPNLGSLMLEVRLKDLCLHLTADEEGDNLAYLDRSVADKDYYIFKFPHHGSKNALNKDLLDRLAMDAVVFSCGKNNPYGHPHERVCQYFQGRKTPCYRTDEQGEITFYYQKDKVKVVTYIED